MTNITVIKANEGFRVWGLTDGLELNVVNVTPCFFFATAPDGREIKISKKTGRACHWSSASTSPTFDVAGTDWEPEDKDAWKAADDAIVAKHRAAA